MIKSKRKVNKRLLIESSLAYGVYGNYPWRFYRLGESLYINDPSRPNFGAVFLDRHGDTVAEIKRWWGNDNLNSYKRRIMDFSAALITR